ncbi:MAG: hypothetical protein WAM39_24395 [Bryobacteraceae bacterium]
MSDILLSGSAGDWWLQYITIHEEKMQKGTKYALTYAGLSLLILLPGCSSGAGGIHEGDQLSSFSQDITSPIHEFRIKAGGTTIVDVTAKNTGTQPWFGGQAKPMTVDASYRWISSDGNVLPIEGNRAQLDRSVIQPGESDALKLPVTAPPNPGSYTLWVSMVQEGVAWFYDKGSKPLVMHVTVE